MKQILTIGILSLFFTSCMTTKRYSTFVDTKTKSINVKNETTRDWIAIKVDKTEPTQTVCEQKKNSFIPAILYWEWNSTIECELDIKTRTEYLKQGILRAVDSLNLQHILSGRKLEIKLKEIPGKFIYENKGNAIIFIIAYTVSGVEAISPYPINLEFEYSIINNGELEIKGEGVIKNTEQPMRNVWKSTKKFTWFYLDKFRIETERMGIELISKIIEEIKMKN